MAQNVLFEKRQLNLHLNIFFRVLDLQTCNNTNIQKQKKLYNYVHAFQETKN